MGKKLNTVINSNYRVLPDTTLFTEVYELYAYSISSHCFNFHFITIIFNLWYSGLIFYFLSLFHLSQFTLHYLAGHSVWNCWVNNFLCCDHVILIFTFTRELLWILSPYAAYLHFASEVSSRHVTNVVKLFTTNVHRSIHTKQLGNWGWFTEKFLFDLTVINNDITKVNTPHLAVWILTCMDISGKKEAMWISQHYNVHIITIFCNK